MSRARLIKDDLRYLLFSEIYQKFESHKAKRRALQIIESAITCMARKGIEGLTMEMVAREIGATKPLIKHYFKDTDELREISLKYIRVIFQKVALALMAPETDERQMLIRWVESCFKWADSFRTHILVWMLFLTQCSGNKNKRELNTMAVRVGEERMQSILLGGKAKGYFHFDDAEVTAKMIQVLVTGAVLTHISEDLSDPKIFVKRITAECLALARIESPRTSAR